MARDEEDRKALGARLATARKLAGLTLEAVANSLTEYGYQYGKAAVSAWENGRNVPDALVVRRLAKLYGTTVDALLWDDALTIEAIRFAAQFDALNDRQQRTFRTLWLAFVADAATDEEVENHIREKVPKPIADTPPAAQDLLGGDSNLGDLDDKPRTRRR